MQKFHNGEGLVGQLRAGFWYESTDLCVRRLITEFKLAGDWQAKWMDRVFGILPHTLIAATVSGIAVGAAISPWLGLLVFVGVCALWYALGAIKNRRNIRHWRQLRDQLLRKVTPRVRYP